MNFVSRTITGSAFVILGIILLTVSFFFVFVLIYAIPILIIGLFILFNKKEDEVEQRKDVRRKLR